MSGLLASMFTGEQLDRAEFVPKPANEFQADLLMLIDGGLCTPECLFAERDSWDTCQCRCDGQHHGHGRTDDLTFEIEADR